METLTKLITFFLIYSFLGWIIESVYKTICEKKLVNSGFLYGPFCPIYGIGAVIIYLILDDYKDNVLQVFILGIVVLSAWEYIVGFLLEKIFKTKYWDYSDKKFNLDGRICLLNSIYWGILSVIYMYIINPFVLKAIECIPYKILHSIIFALIIYILVDTILSIINLNSISKKLDKIKEISENIKYKLLELKKITNAPVKIENIEKVVEELKKQEEILRKTLIRKTENLKKRFPTMKSEKISEFLNHRKR